MTILLADDDADDRFLFESALKEVNEGCRLSIAEDGEMLMHILVKNEHLPDLIILDVNMPKKNGLTCLHEIRQSKKFDPVPVIILSTSSNDKEVNYAYHNGASMFLRKPNSFKALKDIVRFCTVGNFTREPHISRKNFLVLDTKQLFIPG